MRLGLPRFFLAIVLVAVGLAGCSVPATRPIFSDIRFTSQPKIRLDVAAIDVERVFKPTLREPSVEHLFPVPPEIAIENWVSDRLEATNPGAPRRARVRIIDATVKEVELKRTQGLVGAFTTDQAQRYDARVQVTVDILNDRGFPERTADSEATRSQTVKEGITPNERDQIWYDLTRVLMTDLDQKLEKLIRASFGYYAQ